MPAEIGTELRHQRANALLQKSHRARGGAGGFGPDADGAGRGIGHHEGIADHHDHLGAEQPERCLVEPCDAPDQVQQAAGQLQRQAEPDQLLQRMTRRETHAKQVADQIGKCGGCEPCTIFGAGAAHLRHHDVRAAAGERENDLRRQHLAQHVADEGAVPDKLADIAAEAAALGAAAGLRQCKRNADRNRQRRRGDEVEDRAPAECGLEQAAGQGRQHLRDHHHGYDEADHGADAFAAIEIADDGAAYHQTGGAA